MPQLGLFAIKHPKAKAGLHPSGCAQRNPEIYVVASGVSNFMDSDFSLWYGTVKHLY
jgi:hypothetical protein